MSAAPPPVLLCGPFPGPERIGGYARVNEFIASSALAAKIGIARLPVTLPHEGSLPTRLREDLRRVREAVRRPGACVLHVTAQYHAGTYREWLQFRIARREGLRFLLDIRGGCFVEAFDDPRRPLQRRLWTQMLRGADAITVEGRPDGAWLERRFGRHATWFPNFVRAGDRERHLPASLEKPAAGAAIRLVYAGQLRPEKGLCELVQACVLLEAQGLPVTLDLAGVGEAGFLAELAAAAAPLPAGRIRFLGRLGHGDLLGALREAHIFVFPSRWHCEGHSNALNEAMQMGLPVVASKQGFSADVVSPDCGRLLDAPAAEAIAAAVADLASDWDALVACGRSARERVYAEFTDDVALARLEAVYRELLAPR